MGQTHGVAVAQRWLEKLLESEDKQDLAVNTPVREEVRI